jgi:superfamily I DNA/RNA helicase
MSTWLIPLEEMTQEQLRAIELGPQENRVIFGPPGSGKTQVLLHRAKYLCDTWNIPPDRFHVFVYTNVLKDYIKSALDMLDLPHDCVSTLDSWCNSYYKEHIGRIPMIQVGKRCVPDFPAIRMGVLGNLTNEFPGKFFFDFVLVDEGQDLGGVSFDLLKSAAKHVSVCLDNKQQVYENGSGEKEILKRLGLRKRNIYLLGAYRCCPYIISLARQFISDPQERQTLTRQAKTYQAEKQTPLLYYASDFADEKRRLIEILRVSLMRGEKIGLIFPQRRLVYGFAKGLKEAGIDVETMNNLNFTNGLPKLLTYQSAKGLTFDTVLMPGLIQKYFAKVDDQRVKRLLFVGITRATKWVYMSTQTGRELKALEDLKPLEAQGVLTIQTSFADKLPVQEEQEVDSADEQEDILDLL